MQRAKSSEPIGVLPTHIPNPRPSLTEDEEAAEIASQNRVEDGFYDNEEDVTDGDSLTE